MSVALPTLDAISPSELAALPVQYVDGRHDNWFSPPAEPPAA